jgi:hypothetical protein
MRWLIMLFVTALLSNPALADKPEHAGQGKGKGKAKVEQSKHHGKADKSGYKSDSKRHADGMNVFFGSSQRDIIRNYYGDQFKGGHCPPGLAKKNNGCLPPGQAKKWQVGHRLPGDVIYHDLPGDLMRRLGHNDPAYKLIRVGADILKIGVGTGLVVEAVEDLGGVF